MIKSFVVSKGRQSTWCDPLSCGCRCYWRSITGGSLRQGETEKSPIYYGGGGGSENKRSHLSQYTTRTFDVTSGVNCFLHTRKLKLEQ